MNSQWLQEFRQRMDDFSNSGNRDSRHPVSIKIRVASGCFHREHSPKAYEEIDAYLAEHPLDRDGAAFEEHESGPEILVYLAVTTAGLVLAKSVLDLITAVLQARKAGIKKGDVPTAPLEVILRGHFDKDEYHQEVIIRVDPDAKVDPKLIKSAIKGAMKKLPAPEAKKPKKR